MAATDTPFQTTVRAIEREYVRLGHTLGWRFLYTPAATLAPETAIVFLGMNPAGGKLEPPMASVETGNAYRVEHWPGSPLQSQVVGFFQCLASALGQESSWADVMDKALTANVCPFRSPSWEELHEPAASLDFSRAMWEPLGACLNPSLMVLNGDIAWREFSSVLDSWGYRQVGTPVRRKTGWGKVTCGVVRYQHSARRGLTVIQLPQLSRFKLFSREASREIVRKTLVGALTAAPPAASAEPSGTATAAPTCGPTPPPVTGGPAAVVHTAPGAPPVPTPAVTQARRQPASRGFGWPAFWRSLQALRPALARYRTTADGAYLWADWESDVHVSFGRYRNWATVRLNLRGRRMSEVAECRRVLASRLAAAAVQFRDPPAKRGQQGYMSTAVLAPEELAAPDRAADLRDWLARCWDVFEAFRKELCRGT